MTTCPATGFKEHSIPHCRVYTDGRRVYDDDVLTSSAWALWRHRFEGGGVYVIPTMFAWPTSRMRSKGLRQPSFVADAQRQRAALDHYATHQWTRDVVRRYIMHQSRTRACDVMRRSITRRLAFDEDAFMKRRRRRASRSETHFRRVDSIQVRCVPCGQSAAASHTRVPTLICLTEG